MKTVILAGGLGTRLAEETDSRPKPMCCAVEFFIFLSGKRELLVEAQVHFVRPE